MYGIERCNWDGVEEVVDELSEVWDERVALATLDDVILADSAADPDGSRPPLTAQSTVVDPFSEFIDLELPDDPVELREFENLIAETCYELVGVFVEVVDDGAGLPVVVPTRSLTGEEGLIVDDCLDVALDIDDLEPTDPDDLPALQLFVGVGDEPTSVLASGRSVRFWLAIGAIVVGAVALAVLVAQRITGPLRTLTSAAKRMSGDEPED